MNRLPSRDRRYVAEFQLSGVPIARRRYWLVFERGQIDLCYKAPGFEVDLVIGANLHLLTQVWLGHMKMNEASGQGRLRLEGSRDDLAAFRDWFALSPFAPAGGAPTDQMKVAAPPPP